MLNETIPWKVSDSVVLCHFYCLSKSDVQWTLKTDKSQSSHWKWEPINVFCLCYFGKAKLWEKE